MPFVIKVTTGDIIVVEALKHHAIFDGKITLRTVMSCDPWNFAFGWNFSPYHTSFSSLFPDISHCILRIKKYSFSQRSGESFKKHKLKIRRVIWIFLMLSVYCTRCNSVVWIRLITADLLYFAREMRQTNALVLSVDACPINLALRASFIKRRIKISVHAHWTYWPSYKILFTW